jgi:hypothetical protein
MIQDEVDATDGLDKDVSHRVNAVDRWIEDQMLRGNLTVEDASRFLPEQETLQNYKRVLLKHMEATSRKVCDNPCLFSCLWQSRA